ncbi:Hypothetical predicted protein [Cloeon dipterum]|uniref:Uncharacterized protein n=1 Tax=Cloeon dipterum TaxID=197152 RepID=A0A8S1DZ71_9INSE|nr:Hypothetical predicted protein [Cloeon dipterum]
MLDVGLSMKEGIRCRMESGKFTTYLSYPPELDTVRKKRKSRRKGGAKDVTKRLDELNQLEDQNADDSDLEGGGGSKASSDEEEAKDSDNSQASDSDEEMDEGNDYNQMHDVDDDDDMGAPTDDDDGEGIE